MDTIGKRIEMIRGNESRKDFAERLNVPVSTLRNYESDISLPNSDFVAHFCTEMEVNPNWFLFGLSHGVEYPINATRSEEYPSRTTVVRPKVGRYESISSQMDVFYAKASYEIADVLKRNIPLYSRICFLYYENDKNKGYYVSAICKRGKSEFDLYHQKLLCSSFDFFLVEFVSILCVAAKHNVSIYETYTEKGKIDKIISAFENANLDADPMDGSAILHLVAADMLFEEPVSTPTILYGFHEVDPPEEDEE